MKIRHRVASCFRYFTLLDLDHYHALGVDRHASPEVIEAAYIALLEEVNRTAYYRFSALLLGQSPARLRRARKVLLNAKQRSAYDHQLDLCYRMDCNPRY